MSRVYWLTIVTLSVLMQVGCSSAPSKLKAFVFRKPDTDDPLASVTRDDMTASHKSAKKELKKPESMLLEFARWREELGDHAAAKQQYISILADNPDCVEARLGIARVEFATGRVSEAVDILAATTRKFPKHAATWAELGKIQSDRKEWGQAVQSLTKAYELDSSNQAIRYELGVALARSDRLEDARSHLEFAVGESAALYNIGYVLHEGGRSEEAGHWFRRALNSHPDQRTQRAATQMLAELTNGGSLPTQERQPGRIDVALTSFEAYRETPGRPQNTNGNQQQVVGPGPASNRTNVHDQVGIFQPPPQFQTSQVGVPEFQSQSSPPGNSYGNTPQWRGPTGGSSDSSGTKFSGGTVQPPQWGGPQQ